MKGQEFLNDAADLMEQYAAGIQHDFQAIPEDKIWERPIPGQISAANLVLHLTGNLKHFFGRLLGDSDYERDRDREFLDEPYATKEEILTGWDEACVETESVLLSLNEDDLSRDAPADTFPGGAPIRTFIFRLLAHTAYHAGQVRTHYRIYVPPES